MATKHPSPSSSSSAPAEACPVDHATRAAWLKNNGPKHTPFTSVSQETLEASKKASPSCSSTEIDQQSALPKSSSTGSGIFSWLKSPFSSTTASSNPVSSSSQPAKAPSLATHREVSTIPRASSTVPDGHASAVVAPANNEIESGAHSTGNWVYPSEKMFFEAMKRKGYSGVEMKEMKTVVPIHNAVNERAWTEIKEWERPWGGVERCGGPKLHSFLGLPTTLSPKARFNTLLGYTAPFDRHDWVVDRCGTKIEYIIDFYAGRDEGKGNGKLSFYLDVRPKLNTWEGWKMRGLKAVGAV